jgi:protocatechuate 3,4-dioxygenase beta subunit
MATDNITSKILQLVGQKYHASSAAALKKEIILTVSICQRNMFPIPNYLINIWHKSKRAFYQNGYI